MLNILFFLPRRTTLKKILRISNLVKNTWLNTKISNFWQNISSKDSVKIFQNTYYINFHIDKESTFHIFRDL
jgi:hypothetical protein